MPILLGKYPNTSYGVKIPNTTALQPLPTSQGTNGITYNLGEDGKLTIDMWVMFYELPTYASAALYDVRYLFQRSLESNLVDEGKVAQLHGGINYDGRMILFIDRRIGSLGGGGANPLTGGGIHDTTITAVLKDSGTNFRYDYLTAGNDTVGSAAYDNAKTKAFSNLAVWAITPKNVITTGTLVHLTYMLTGNRMKMFKNGLSVADFLSPLGTTAFNSDQLNFISTNWYLGTGSPVSGGYQPSPLPRCAMAGWRLWNGWLNDYQVPFLLNHPFDQYAELKNSANDTVKVVTSYTFDLFSNNTIDNTDYGGAFNPAVVNGTFTMSDIPVPASLLSLGTNLSLRVPYAPTVSSPQIPR